MTSRREMHRDLSPGYCTGGAFGAPMYPTGWLHSWAIRMRNLRAWDGCAVVVDRMRVLVGDPESKGWQGLAGRHQRGCGDIDIVVHSTPANALSTLVHEMAHLAAMVNGRMLSHGRRWRSIFAAAIGEVTGRELDAVPLWPLFRRETTIEIDIRAEDAIADYLERTQ
jgi:SprT-like family